MCSDGGKVRARAWRVVAPQKLETMQARPQLIQRAAGSRTRDADQTAADPARHREQDRDTGQTAADPKEG